MQVKPMAEDESISPEENAITPDEFEKIEKKIGKKGGPGKAPAAPEETRRVKTSDASDVEKLSMDIDMLRGKMEMQDAVRARFDDRMTQTSEEIGELRSSLLEKEKLFGQVETGFRKMKDTMDEVEPQKFGSMLRKLETGVEECQAKLEGTNFKVKKANEDIAKINTLLDKIKSFENLVDMGKNIESVLGKVKDSESTSRRFASKVERIFGELDTRIIEFSRQKDRVDKMQNLVDEVVGSMDGIEAKLKRVVLKDDFEKLKQETGTDFDAFKSDVNDKINDLKDIVDLMVSTIERRAKRVITLEGRMERLEVGKQGTGSELSLAEIKSITEEAGRENEPEKDLPEMELPADARASMNIPEIVPDRQGTAPAAAGAGGETDRLYDMLNKALEYLGNGDFTVARELYVKILEVYESVSPSMDYEESVKLYDSIKDLYQKLTNVYGSDMDAL